MIESTILCQITEKSWIFLFLGLGNFWTWVSKIFQLHKLIVLNLPNIFNLPFFCFVFVQNKCELSYLIVRVFINQLWLPFVFFQKRILIIRVLLTNFLPTSQLKISVALSVTIFCFHSHQRIILVGPKWRLTHSYIY